MGLDPPGKAKEKGYLIELLGRWFIAALKTSEKVYRIKLLIGFEWWVWTHPIAGSERC
ncbi:hypothetical protein JCM19000A_12550 [Silvimonas sp. JCM 19000]